MKIYRPLWSEGALLSPQQFQQQALWEAHSNQCVAHLSVVNPWGVATAEFDEGLLSVRRLQALQLTVRLPDGSLIDTRSSDLLPPARDLSQDIPAQVNELTVMLAMPLLQANSSNVQLTDNAGDRPLRYRQEWVNVQDAFGLEEESMAVARYALSLRFDTEQNEEYLICPVLRLVRDGQGGWRNDSTFIPPLLAMSAHHGLVLDMEQILTQLQAKRRRLMGMRRESNQRMADFAVADVSLDEIPPRIPRYKLDPSVHQHPLSTDGCARRRRFQRRIKRVRIASF